MNKTQSKIWNEKHKVGTPVIVYELMNPRRGETIKTTTRSEAWDIGNVSVALVAGKSGGVALDAIEIQQR